MGISGAEPLPLCVRSWSGQGQPHRGIIITMIIIKGSRREFKIQEFVYRDATNVEPEMYDCTSNNWSHWNSNEMLKEKF
jgi:hypothetical protein